MSTVASSTLQLEPAPPRAKVWLYLLTFALPVLTTLVAVSIALASDGAERPVFGSTILDSTAATLVISVLGVALLTAPIAWLLARMLRRHGLELDEHEIRLQTCVHRETLSLAELKLEEARVLDIHEQTAYRPRFQTNAFALPGFQSGWYRLRNGEKALVASAGGRRLLRLPTTRGYCLMLQARQPQALLEKLQEMARTPSRR